LARIAGVDLPPSKRIDVGLTYIYGIGRARSSQVLLKAKIDPAMKVKDLSDEEANRIQRVINQEGRVEGDLHKAIQLDIKRLIEIGSYRGMRHRRNLPVRGQRTHTNARTRRGPRRAIAGKKPAKSGKKG
jgi:small subunit ribosomal protein S13